MHLVDLLSMSFMVIGLVVGTAVGLGAAVTLHLLFPSHDLQAVQAFLIGSSLIVGAFIGSRFDLEKDRER